MIEVKDLWYKVPKGRVVLNEVSFVANSGEFFGILGRNGSGKTTLLDLLMGFRPIGRGFIKINGREPQTWAPGLSQKVAFLSQEVKFQKNFSILEQLRYHAFYYSTYDFKIEKSLLDYFEIDVKQKIGSLSTGEQKKVQIIGGLSMRSEVIIIDEITAVLDPETRFRFFCLLEDIHKKKQCTIVLATNIVEDLKNRVDKVIFIDKSKIIHADPSKIDKLFHIP